MASVFDGAYAYVGRLVRQGLQSRFVNCRPLIWFMAMEAQTNLEYLIKAHTDPQENWKRGVILGGSSMGLATRETIDGSIGLEVRNQKAAPTGSANISPGGSTPTATVFSENLVGTAEYRWNKKGIALKVMQETVDAVMNGKIALGKPLEEAVAMSCNQFYEDVYREMWSGSLTLAQQNLQVWQDGILGLTHIVDDGTTSGYEYVGRVDRRVETYLQATVKTASSLVTGGYLPSTVPNLSLISKIRSIPALGGMSNRDAKAGTLALTTPDLFSVLREEAEGQHIVYEDIGAAVPNAPDILKAIGMSYPVIKKDQTYITYDPQCPSGHLYLLTPGTFVYQLQSGYNYKQNSWQQKKLNEEGGGDYEWMLIELKQRLGCLRHDLQFKCTGLTTT